MQQRVNHSQIARIMYNTTSYKIDTSKCSNSQLNIKNLKNKAIKIILYQENQKVKKSTVIKVSVIPASVQK